MQNPCVKCIVPPKKLIVIERWVPGVGLRRVTTYVQA